MRDSFRVPIAARSLIRSERDVPLTGKSVPETAIDRQVIERVDQRADESSL